MTSRSPSLPRQRGNTLTGIIIGLIIGLGIAVAVALAITKGASPFTDKAVKTGRPADPAPGQATDPNKPLYGSREAAREANRELAEKAGAKAAADAAPLGQATAGGGDGYIYYLQAGAFREMADAEAARAKLALLGFEATISDHSSDSGVLHRVRLGPYGQPEAMNKARAKLLDNGVVVATVRNQK